MKFLFIIDGSDVIGSVGVTRSLAIADELTRRGCVCLFVRAPNGGVGGEADDYLRARGFETRSREAVKRGEFFNYIIVDRYGLDYVNSLEDRCEKILFIDDLIDENLPLDRSANERSQERDRLARKKCVRISSAKYALLDPIGAQRVAEILTLNRESKIDLREATIDDEAAFLELANDELTRENSFNRGVISPSIHHAWFQRKLADRENAKLFAVETGVLTLGYARFEAIDDRWQISYALAPYARGFGLGKTALRKAIERLGAVKLTAKVKETNAASCKTFEALGFIGERDENGVVTYNDIQ
jgi:RimJ/RimL family protein N-acetyltransferase